MTQHDVTNRFTTSWRATCLALACPFARFPNVDWSSNVVGKIVPLFVTWAETEVPCIFGAFARILTYGKQRHVPSRLKRCAYYTYRRKIRDIRAGHVRCKITYTPISYSLEGSRSVGRKSIGGGHSSRREPASQLRLIMGHRRIDPISHYGFNRVSFAPGPL